MLLMVKLKNDKVIRDLVIRVQATRIHYDLENTEFEANNAAILPINYKICYIMNNRLDFQQRKNAFINRRESPREERSTKTLVFYFPDFIVFECVTFVIRK